MVVPGALRWRGRDDGWARADLSRSENGGCPRASLLSGRPRFWKPGVSSFPAPVAGMDDDLDFAQHGELWGHVCSSLFGVGVRFIARRRRRRSARLVGWVRADHVPRWNSDCPESLRPISPIAWIPIAILWLASEILAPIFLIFPGVVVPNDCSDYGRGHTISGNLLVVLGGGEFRCSRRELVLQVVVPTVLPQSSSACASPRRSVAGRRLRLR